MRVGFDITPLAGHRTGVGNYCYYLLKQLVASGGCDVLGFCSGLHGVDVGGLPVVRVAVPTRALYKSWEWLQWPRIDTLMRGIDVYHATNYVVPPARSARRVVTFHDLAFMKHPEWCSPKISALFARGAARYAADADAIIACSESTRQDTIELLGADPGKVTVAYEAVDEDFKVMDRAAAAELLATKYNVRQPFLLFVGTLEPRKNLPTLLRAFARLKGDIPHTLVLAGGRGWNSEGIFEVVDELGLNKRVVCTGFISPHHELSAFYSAADAFVFPSLYEGFGLPLLEAMTCGCPIVASDNSSIPEVMGGAGLCVAAEDDEAMAEAISKLLQDAPLRHSLVARGLVQAGKFSWAECARVTLDVYKRARAS